MTNTIIVELDIGARVLELEQLADLEARAISSVIHHQTGPYWAYLWPSERALARFIGERAELAGKRVLELGCGLGAAGIAAASCGADVLVSDLREEAVEMSKKNATRNQLEVHGVAFDWNDPPQDLGKFDVIIAADVFYEDGFMASVLRFLKSHLERSGIAWLADPMRVIASGVAGAARFHGLETSSQILVEGQMMTGGVTLHELRFRSRGLR